jgi:hypothetical protein
VYKGTEFTGDSEVWSQSDIFTKIKVIRHLIQLDVYLEIARYGTSEYDLEEELSQNQINIRRYNALKRISTTISMVLRNSYFVFNDMSKSVAKGFLYMVRVVEPFIEKTLIERVNSITHEKEYVLNEKLFSKIFQALEHLSGEILYPINKAGLIFRQSEEFDLDKISRDISLGG